MKLVHSNFYFDKLLWNLKKKQQLLNDFEAQNPAGYIPLSV